MPRKQEVVVVPAWPGNRDGGKQFLITEMSAAKAEKWAYRLFIALKGAGERIPENVAAMGMVGLAIAGLNVFLRAPVKAEDVEPLMDEMMTCVTIVRDPKAVDKDTGGPVGTELVSDDDIEEVQTRAWLRSEVVRVHTGFSPAGALSSLISAATSAAEEGSPATRTSPP